MAGRKKGQPIKCKQYKLIGCIKQHFPEGFTTRKLAMKMIQEGLMETNDEFNDLLKSVRCTVGHLVRKRIIIMLEDVPKKEKIWGLAELFEEGARVEAEVREKVADERKFARLEGILLYNFTDYAEASAFAREWGHLIKKIVYMPDDINARRCARVMAAWQKVVAEPLSSKGSYCIRGKHWVLDNDKYKEYLRKHENTGG